MTLPIKSILVTLALALSPGVTHALTSSEIFDRLDEAQYAGYEDIDNYTQKTKTMEVTTFDYFEKTAELELDSGKTVYIMSRVPEDEIVQRHSGVDSPMANASAEELRQAAAQIEAAGQQAEAGMMAEVESAGFPGGIGSMIMNPPGNKPWLSANPRDMTSMYSTMLNAVADEKDQRDAEDPVGDAQQRAASMARIKDLLEIAGRGKFKGVEAVELVAADLNYTTTEDGMTTTWEEVRMQVDAKRYVPLLLTMKGVVDDGTEKRPITVEREDMDYRNVPGCGDLYKPFKSVMRLGGMMTPEQRAEIAEAAKQMEELEAQMASMPASQRQMMERMVGPQMKMLRNMASGGGIEVESTVVELRCNTGLPNPMEVANTTFGSAFGVPDFTAPSRGGAVKTDTDLLQVVQRELKRIGYQPGNTDGVLDKLTIVAISKFQAKKGMEVTGQPSPQLAGILQAEQAGGASTGGSSNNELSAVYLEGHWCSQYGQERSLYNFAADGSYRLGVLGITITEFDGVNYFPETYSRQKFLDSFRSVISKNQDQFAVKMTSGRSMNFERGNCFEGGL